MSEPPRPLSSTPAFPAIPPVAGVELGALAAGLTDDPERLDLMMACFAPGTVAAGCFTKNQVKAAPIVWSEDVLAARAEDIRAVIVNAGNANALTGRRGMRTAQTMAESAASLAQCEADQVLVASTGLMGVTMAPGPLRRGIKRLEGGLSGRLYRDAACAICTNDTYPKGAFRVITLGGQPVTVAGIAKGGPYIAPCMASVLGFIFTSANVSAAALQAILNTAVEQSFNAITVAGDMSPSDCVFAFATGRGGGPRYETSDDPALTDLARGVTEVCRELAMLVVQDGDMPRKFVTIEVTGAEDEKSAREIGRLIASSRAVRRGIAASEGAWAAVFAAAGQAQTPIKFDEAQLVVGGQLVAHHGSVHLRYDEAAVKAHFESGHVSLQFHAAAGQGRATIWTTVEAADNALI